MFMMDCADVLCIRQLLILFKDQRYKEAVLKISTAIKQEMGRMNPACTNIGGSYGIGSVVYSFAFAGASSKISDLIRISFELSSLITPRLIENDSEYDIVHGNAGSILALIALLDANKVCPTLSEDETEAILQKASQCGEFLLFKAEKTQHGFRWPTKFVTGFSHGSAGIAYSLYTLGLLTGNQNFMVAVQNAIIFEDSHLSFRLN